MRRAARRPASRAARRAARLPALLALSLLLVGSAVAPPTLPTTRLLPPDGPISGSAGNGLADAETVAARLPGSAAIPATNAFSAGKVSLGLSRVASGFVSPVLVTNAGDGSGRLFVVEQAGRVRIISGGTVLAAPFLDLRGQISTGGERGMLGLAFHPRFPTTPYVYVSFTDTRGNSAINRYTVGSDRNSVVKTSGLRIITVAQPYANHNGGNIAFGPDGYLYIGLGDGGGAGDPGNRAQSLNSLLGKILRIDVNGTSGSRKYRIPSSNPYVGRTGLDEIWSRGLRNPWRWSFDRLTAISGSVMSDKAGTRRSTGRTRSDRRPPAEPSTSVGASSRVASATTRRPVARPAGRQPPLVVYGHAVAGADNCSVTGGFVYRGRDYPVLAGGYVFGDYCSGRIWVVSAGAYTPATPTLVRDATASPQLSISSFGEDDRGSCTCATSPAESSTGSARPPGPDRRAGRNAEWSAGGVSSPARSGQSARKSRQAAATSSGSANSS